MSTKAGDTWGAYERISGTTNRTLPEIHWAESPVQVGTKRYMRCLAQNKALTTRLVKCEKVMRNLHCMVLSKRPDPHRGTTINPRSIIAPVQNPMKNIQLKISGRQILLCTMTPHSQGLALSYEFIEKEEKSACVDLHLFHMWYLFPIFNLKALLQDYSFIISVWAIPKDIP